MSVNTNNVLLVEGNDDQHIFWALLKHHQIPERFKVKEKGGIDNLLDTLDVELLGSGVERLGVVIDADIDIAARWQRLRSILMKAGYSKLPKRPHPDGTVLQQDSLPLCGVWLMPNNKIPGMVEDFIQFLVPETDTLWDKANHCLEEVIGEARFPTQHRSKAHLYTWLAWQEQPGRPIGTAITCRYLDPDAPQAILLMNWIRRLFID